MHDVTTHGQAWAHPGNDTRQWCSFATVDPETDGQKSVTFTDEYGPLVNVTLRPSGIPAVCRVAHEVAGNGEGEWFPFVGGDEVIVLIPEGDETAGCCIVGRLNQEIDAWPKTVAGQDATTNTFGFRRLRVPYVIETAAPYLIRHATTGAFIGINEAGAVTLSNADNGFLTLTASLIGIQNGDGDVLVQIDVANKQVVLEAAGTKMTLDALLSTLLSTGVIQVAGAGNPAGEHVLTTEALYGNLVAIALGLSTMSPPMPITNTTTLAAALTALFTGSGVPQLALGLLTEASAPLPPTLSAAIAAAFTAATPKPPPVPGLGQTKPGIGCPGTMAG